ncbi:MAG: two-component system response regulator CreB [Verrucomicrobiales bacterium]|nr:two-component system response regulator CreB [Verrucomicrobiales bacterium]
MPGSFPCLVLVVEDEPSIAETIEYALKTEGFDVVHAGTGREALAAFDQATPGFVVLDVGLPDQSGFDVCREIRRRGTTPVLFLTAREGEIDRIVGLEIGADDYVVKPFSPRELVARIRAILRRTSIDRTTTAPLPGSSQRHGPIEIDPDKMRVLVSGQALALSRYEFRILTVLLKHPGRVYTREQLMDLVWDEPEAAMERTVDAHIKSLRAKLREAVPDFDPIVTHRGTGYSLREDL